MSEQTTIDIAVAHEDLVVALSVLRHDLTAGYFDSTGDFETTVERILGVWQAASDDPAPVITMPVEDWVAVADLLGTNPGQAPNFLLALDRALDACGSLA